ncbi:Lsr2 family protein [Rathayibacter sp. AY1G1]|uniref:histone-like nucleoid-structuring protein Lsr2 n=1 Tax=Rathayibacter sp. AY1G1 TaxID=2080564 RepID=UPI000CE7C067|nr:Lsr2 family protein [Rathayibacter sp. AY1G1]PPH10474.1 Lsr2 family protein [Rathayibacter sp. AY1G1]
MAQKMTLVDDLDGSPIEDGGGTVRFSIDGANYEIDLSEKNTAQLTQALEKYVSAGRRVRAGGSSTPTVSAKKSDPQRLKAIREWANENGHEVSNRGRISAEIVEAYDAAN